MNYSRAVKTGNWHQAREAEPKDYDMNKAPVRNLSRSTYRLIGNVTEGKPLPSTTYEDMSTSVFREHDAYAEKPDKRPMISEETLRALDINSAAAMKHQRHTLPSHHPDYSTLNTETTYVADFGSPYPFTRASDRPQAEEANHTNAYKRCLSQFTDTAGSRREGRNTFTDESGMYHNSAHRTVAPPYHRRDPILTAFQS